MLKIQVGIVIIWNQILEMSGAEIPAAVAAITELAPLAAAAEAEMIPLAVEAVSAVAPGLSDALAAEIIHAVINAAGSEAATVRYLSLKLAENLTITSITIPGYVAQAIGVGFGVGVVLAAGYIIYKICNRIIQLMMGN